MFEDNMSMEPRLLQIGSTHSLIYGIPGALLYITQFILSYTLVRVTARILFQEENPQNWLMNFHLRCLQIFLQITLELCFYIETQMAPQTAFKIQEPASQVCLL
jgi:hypothetical protein